MMIRWMGAGIIGLGTVLVPGVGLSQAATAAGAKPAVAAMPPAVMRSQVGVLPTKPPSAAAIQQWIKELGSDNAETREVASKKLLAGGLAVVTDMRKALAGMTTPVMRQLLRQDIQTLDTAELMGPVRNRMPSPGVLKLWIATLNSIHFRLRQAAERDLIASGDAVIPAIKTALDRPTTPEMRHLLRRAIRRIGAFDLIRGPLITIDARHVPGRKVFAMICKQAGIVPNLTQAGAVPDVSFHVRHAPFWAVMQRMADLTGVSLGQSYGSEPIVLVPGNGLLYRHDIISMDGGFAVVAQNVTYNRSIDLSSPHHPASDSFSLQLWLLAVPNSMTVMQVQPVITKAVDSHGNMLAPANGTGYGSGQGWASNIQIPLQWPDRPGSRITKLQGYMRIIASCHKKMLNLKLKAKGISRQTIGNVHFSAGNLKLVKGQWQFTYSIRQNAGAQPFNWGLVNQVQNVYGDVYGATRQQEQVSSSQQQGGNWQQGITYTITMQAGQKPAAVRATVYTGQQKFKVPFDLKNIPMP